MLVRSCCLSLQTLPLTLYISHRMIVTLATRRLADSPLAFDIDLDLDFDLDLDLDLDRRRSLP